MGVEDGLRADGVVVEKAISRFGFGPRAAGLGDGRGGMLGKVAGHGDQASDEALVRQLGSREFVAGPVRVGG